MSNDIVLLELFSGIGGFSLGLQQSGFKFKKHYFSEINKHSIANYKYNFKNAEHIGSVTNVQQWGIERPNIITFGSPCQDFSLAGNGKGLGGTKSSLIQYSIEAIQRFRPDVFIWENVKGAYSTNDSADYWAIIQAFANLDGYRHEQQLLNTTWVLPQNRERIYHIGYLPERCEGGILPIGNRFTRDIQTVKNKEKGIANTLSTQTPGKKRCADGTVIGDEKGIRDFTEIESERLQGFPDNWTKLGDYNGILKEIPKSARYFMCGNAVTALLVKEIGDKIKLKY